MNIIRNSCSLVCSSVVVQQSGVAITENRFAKLVYSFMYMYM